MEEVEIWKPIPGFEEVYSASSLGRIRRDSDSPRGTAGETLKGWVSRYGYLNIRLSDGPRRPTLLAHRLVMLAFVGPCPANKEINHKNGIKTDNRLQNLEYVTRQENMRHAFATGLNKPHHRGGRKGSPPGYVSSKVAKLCQFCGVEFLSFPSLKRVFCCRKCKDTAGRDESKYAVQECLRCGATFRYLIAQIGPRKYCSKKCANLSRDRDALGRVI